MIYLHVPFEQKDDAKSMGAKWDPEKKLWYAPDESFKQLIQKYSALAPTTNRTNRTNRKDTSTNRTNRKDTSTINSISDKESPEPHKPLVIIGENRRFGGNELYVDILPKGSNISLRRLLSDNDFYRLRNLLVKRVAYRCEICGEECISSERKYLEVCELFSFNFNTHVQRLERLIAICKPCYKTTKLLDKDLALEHLMDINGLDKEDAKQHIFEAFDTWKTRSEIKWTVELSIITNSGLKIGSPKKKDENKVSESSESVETKQHGSKITINKMGSNNSSNSSSRPNSSNSSNRSNSSNTSNNSINKNKNISTDTKKITINKINSNISKKETCMFEDD